MGNEKEVYGLSAEKSFKQIDAPPMDYLPRLPKRYNPKIGLIGAGGISEYHLKNYQVLGLNVAAIADSSLCKAIERKNQFYPDAEVYDDYTRILDREDIEVVDITTHPMDRLSIIKDAILAKKHVLSQKPFVLDIKDGLELVTLAKATGVKLAVNQNGRWAPHYSYMLEAIKMGLIGRPISIDFSLQWDQTWIKGSSFEDIHHMILFDFGIHWFDITAAFMEGQEVLSVFASTVKYDEQDYVPPALASCIIDYKQAQVRMAFNAHTRCGEQDVTTIVGTKGTLRSRGPGLNDQPIIEIYTDNGSVEVPLQGCWFENGFQGTMGELLCSIEENREPFNSGESTLNSLKLCFAALESANTNKVVAPGAVNTVR